MGEMEGLVAVEVEGRTKRRFGYVVLLFFHCNGGYMKTYFAVLVAALLMVGCGQLKPYQQPELYFLKSEQIKKQVGADQADSADADRLQIQLAPARDIVEKNGTYSIEVIDKCDGAVQPKINVTPSTAANTSNLNKVGNKTTLILDSTNLLEGTRVVVSALSCRASQMTMLKAEKKGLWVEREFLVKPNQPINEAGSVEIQMDAPNIRANSGTYKVRISNKCASGATSISVVPSTAESVGSRSTTNPGLTEITIDSANLSEGGSVVVSALSCNAANISLKEAKKKGHLVVKTIHVVPTSHKEVTSKLVIWSRNDTENEFGRAFADLFYAADVSFVNPNDKPLLVYGSSLSANIRFLAAKADLESKYGTTDPSVLEKVKDRLDFKEPWRPMAFSDILAIFTYNKDAEPRSRMVAGLKSLGEVFTGGAVFNTSAGYIRGVGFFTGVLVPEIEKQLLWDIMLHLKNVEARSLKEIEEVPQQGQLRKVVFFPRTPISGILPEMPVYIAEIRPDPASVIVTPITKGGTVVSTPPDTAP